MILLCFINDQTQFPLNPHKTFFLEKKDKLDHLHHLENS